MALPASSADRLAGHFCACAALLAWLSVAGLAAADDRIILRNLDLIADRTVVSVDEDGALLDEPLADGSDRLSWDSVERGRVAEDLQADFNRFQAELGPPLYKLRLRLKIGDYAGLVEPAEALFPQFSARRSQTAYLVCQSLMWGRLATGRREEAVEPFLRCVVLLKSGAAEENRLPGARRLLMDGLICRDLPPVWLKRQAAAEVLPSAWEFIKALPMPRPAEAYLYYASLASEAGQFDEADKVLDVIPSGDATRSQAVQAIRSQIAVQSKQESTVDGSPIPAEKTQASAAALARYWRGMRLLASADRDQKRDGLLMLLSLPAEERSQAEIAAAALSQSAAGLSQLGDAAASAAVRRELAAKYSATAVGIQVLTK